MNREDITRMAREAGFVGMDGDHGSLRRFAALVAAAEREQGQKWFEAVTAQHKQEILAERETCAKVCDRVGYHHEVQQGAELAFDLAAAIRERSANAGAIGETK